jgi:hypothetical protein
MQMKIKTKNMAVITFTLFIIYNLLSNKRNSDDVIECKIVANNVFRNHKLQTFTFNIKLATLNIGIKNHAALFTNLYRVQVNATFTAGEWRYLLFRG